MVLRVSDKILSKVVTNYKEKFYKMKTSSNYLIDNSSNAKAIIAAATDLVKGKVSFGVLNEIVKSSSKGQVFTALRDVSTSQNNRRKVANTFLHDEALRKNAIESAQTRAVISILAENNSANKAENLCRQVLYSKASNISRYK